MTTIIAKKTANGSVDIAYDSQSTGQSVTRSEKVFGKNNQMIVGVAGRTRYSNVLRYIDVPEIHPAEFERDSYDVLGYLITQVVPAWVEGLEQQFKRIPDQKEDWPEGLALVVMKGRIFEVHFDFTVTEAEGDMFGIGSGAGYALGALAAGKSVEKAIQIAEKLDLYTGGDLHVMKGVK